jgi:hypothetical protein
MKLPEMDYFTPAELAERWGKDKSYVMNLIGQGKLLASDSFAASHGKRRTFFLFPDAPVARQGPHVSDLHTPRFPGKKPEPTDDDLIVTVEGVSDDGYEVLKSVSMSYGSDGLVVLLRDVEAFEAAHTAPAMTDTDQKRRHVSQRVRELQRDGFSLNAAWQRVSSESPTLGTPRNVRRIYEDAVRNSI